MRAMRGAERIVDEEVAAGGELARERLVVLGLARVEARVLEHAQALVGQELAQAALDRLQRILRVGALRTAEMRADANLCGGAVEQQAQRPQRRSNAHVVADPAALQPDL